MLKNNHQKSVCNQAEPLMSYLYGEIGDAEKAEFEIHLKNCAACENELAEFGFARTAVQDWKAKEFDVLPTPTFAIPSNTTKTFVNSEESVSWLENFKRIFQFRPALAMSAFAVMIAVAGAALFFVNFRDSNQIAAKADDNNLVAANVSPTVEKVVEQPKQINDEIKVGVEEKSVAPTVSRPEILPVPVKKTSSPYQSVMKAAVKKPKNETPNDAPLPDFKAVNSSNKKSPTIRKPKVPSLTETEDAEDNSVRLADLFDELDTK